VDAVLDRSGRGGGISIVAVGIGAGAVIGAILGTAGIASGIGIAGAALWLLSRNWNDEPSGSSKALCPHERGYEMAGRQ